MLKIRNEKGLNPITRALLTNNLFKLAKNCNYVAGLQGREKIENI
jgi:hypothetical protein